MNYFLIPVFNEALNIPELSASLKAVLPHQPKYYVFVDDCSTDNTVEELKRNFTGESLHIIQKPKNAGPGDSFNQGMEWVLENGNVETDLVITLEGDNTSDLEILDQMVAAAGEGYEVILASVYSRGGRFEQTSLFKKFVSSVANASIRLAFGLKIKTLSSFYRVYSLGVLRRIKSQYGVLIAEPGFVCMVEMVVKSAGVGARLLEIPTVLHSSRRKGSSKMNMIRTTFGYLGFIVRFAGTSR